MGMPPIADMEMQQSIVSAALAEKSRTQTLRKARFEVRSENRQGRKAQAIRWSNLLPSDVASALIPTPFQQRREICEYQ
jgi:hypothetical protein